MIVELNIEQVEEFKFLFNFNKRHTDIQKNTLVNS